MDKAELETKLKAYGLEYKAVFVPQSASRNSAEKNPSLNWRVTFKRVRPGYLPGSPIVEIIATDYMQGIGRVPESDADLFKRYGRRGCIGRGDYERRVAESGQYGIAGKPLPPPALADVLHSLLLDGDAADETFEDWCSNYGYDSDSRKAETIYNACRDVGRQLQRMFTRAELDELRELFQDY